jgi:hypothetical protein
MNFRSDDTIAGYARDAVDLRIRMVEYHQYPLARTYLRAYLQTGSDLMPDRLGPVTDDAVEAMLRIAAGAWEHGEAYVCAPAMTAIVAAAADALDLTGEIRTSDVAPSDSGVLFFPEPIYHRHLHGEVSSIGAISWSHVTTTETGRITWCIALPVRDEQLGRAARRSAHHRNRDPARRRGPRP